MYLLKSIIKSNKSITELLFDVISDYDIYCELIGYDAPIGSAFSSPLRQDNSPSFSLFIPTIIKNVRSNEMWWTDFTLGSGNIFKFVKLFEFYTNGIVLNNYTEIVQHLDKKLNLGLFDRTSLNYKKRYVDYEYEKQVKSIFFKSREFTLLDFRWWINYGIDKPLLNLYNVRSLRYILNDDYTIKYTYKQNELGYVYVIYDKIKLYSPYAGDFKWRNTCPSHYVMGDEQRKNSDTIIITKSLKDIMTFVSFMNVDVVSPQSETTGIPEEKLKEYSRYKNKFVVMDFDKAGIAAANKLEKYGYKIVWVSTKTILISGKSKVIDKDISDYTKKHGYQQTFNHLKNTMFPVLKDKYFKSERINELNTLNSTLSL